MEKLIELLNEWYLERYGTNPHFVRFEDYWGNDYWYFHSSNDENLMVETEVWTKKYWFIKWLVENNKIDNSKFYDKNILKWFMTLTKEEKADSIIMNLSIQKTPIEFLVSILK